jgi:hypothetical protein
MQLEGQIRDINVVERLVELWREKFTGAFRFEQDGVIKILYFKAGDVLSASTNDRTDSVDEILLRGGKVSREHIKQALAKRKENETLGDALLNLGFITRKELTWARRVQVIGILRSISMWQEGSYTGVADYLPKREEGTLFPLPQVILELIVTDSDRAKFEQAMDGGAAVFAKTPDFDEAYHRLGLNEDADDIVKELDGEKSAADVASDAGKDAFNVYKLIEALRALGLVTRVERTHGAPEVAFDDFESAGVSDASDVWAATPGPELELPATMETPVPADVPLVAPAPAAEPEPAWGFDEAQIETARRAAEPEPVTPVVLPPAPAEKPKQGTRWGLMVSLLLLAILLAAGGFYGWQWWQAQHAPASQPVAKKQGPIGKIVTPAAPPPAPSAPPGLTATMTGNMPTTTTTTGTATTFAGDAGIRPAAATNTATGTAPAGGAGIRPAPATNLAATPQRVAATTTAPNSTTIHFAGHSGAKPAPMKVSATAPQPATATASGTTRLERSSTGAATITNTGAAPKAAASKSDDADRAKYDAMARQQAADPVGVYTVQFELVCETSSITKAMNAGRSTVWWVPVTYRGRPCYRVFWGRFSTREEALKAAADIPAALHDSSPVVVKIPR